MRDSKATETTDTGATELKARVAIRSEVKPEDRCKFTSGDWRCRLHKFGDDSEYCFHHQDMEAADDEEVWKVEVIADYTNKWYGSQLRFKTREEAEEYGRDLASRWTLVREWRVVGEWQWKEGREKGRGPRSEW